MSEREVRRAAVLAQIAAKEWRLREAAERMELSYGQTKRVWKRYRKHGAAGLVHGSAGRRSNRAKPQKLRAKVLGLIRAQYSGEPGERFGPTLAAEHLASERESRLGRAPCGGGCWQPDCGAGREKCERIATGEPAENISANWCRWTAASTSGGRTRATRLFDEPGG